MLVCNTPKDDPAGMMLGVRHRGVLVAGGNTPSERGFDQLRVTPQHYLAWSTYLL